MTLPPNPLVVIERLGYLLAVVATGLGGAWWGWRGLMSAAAGGAIACGNLWVMRRLLDRALHEAAAGAGAEAATRRLLAGLALKTPILAALVYVAIVYLALEPAPFVLGLSSLIVALVLGGLYLGYRER